MEAQIVECVPNFSEGRDRFKIKQITDEIESVSGIKLLDVDPGADTNRTVVTFVGSPEMVLEAAFKGIAKASQIIDMKSQKGAHPRIGSTDVVPFIPVSGITMDECAALAQKLAKRVGEELSIPVYLYEHAATTPERKNLANIRKGEYEGLEEKLRDPHWQPDFGPARFHAGAGATVIGAREFLVAYNITLNTRDKSLATDIAFELREKGRVARSGGSSSVYSKGKMLFYAEGSFPCGSCDFTGKTLQETIQHCHTAHNYDLKELLAANDVDVTKPLAGQKVYRPGTFKFCKAIGWYVDEYKRAQLSINLTNYRITPPHVVLEEARRLAQERGLVVTGSEIVGLVPFQALLDAGLYYLKKQGKSTGIPTADILECAVFSMGLNDVQPFDISKKVLGLPEIPAQALMARTVHGFIDEVSRDTTAPGGGSIAALAGSIGAALASMVANITQGKVDDSNVESDLCTIADEAQRIKWRLAQAVDEDTNAFNVYMEARRLPATTAEEKMLREQKMLQGLKLAVEVPWQTACESFKALELAGRAAKIGNANAITDAAVGAQISFTGLRGGVWNVLINLKDINDPEYVAAKRTACEDLVIRAQKHLDEVIAFVEQRLCSR